MHYPGNYVSENARRSTYLTGERFLLPSSDFDCYDGYLKSDFIIAMERIPNHVGVRCGIGICYEIDG
jgi:hypothetical protein